MRCINTRVARLYASDVQSTIESLQRCPPIGFSTGDKYNTIQYNDALLQWSPFAQIIICLVALDILVSFNPC